MSILPEVFAEVSALLEAFPADFERMVRPKTSGSFLTNHLLSHSKVKSIALATVNGNVHLIGVRKVPYRAVETGAG